MALSEESIQILKSLNPWWESPHHVRPEPPPFRRPLVLELSRRMGKPRGLIEVVRGPRQVGKTTGIHQIVQDRIQEGIDPGEIPRTLAASSTS